MNESREGRLQILADDADMEEPGEGLVRQRRRRLLLRVGAGTFAVAVVALVGLWMERKPIADHFIAQALRDRGVTARYRIARIGPSTQRLENVVLGPPDHPDLTARSVEVDLHYGFSGVHVSGLRADGVRLVGRYHDGKLDLGALDKLMGTGGGPAGLPDMTVRLSDAQAQLATDYGPVAASLEGVGNLRSGFIGDLGLSAPRIAAAGCVLNRVTAPLKLTTDGGALALKGPVRAATLACATAALDIAAPRIDADLRTDPALSALSGAFGLSAQAARQADRRFDRLSGLFTVKGSVKSNDVGQKLVEMRGSASLSSAAASIGPVKSGAIGMGGNFALRLGGHDRAYSFAPTFTAEQVRAADPSALGRFAGRLDGTPLAPLAMRFVKALGDASEANRLTITGRIDGDGRANGLLVSGAQFVAASGAHIGLVPGAELRAELPRGSVQLRGEIEMRGGGLPQARATIVPRPGGALSGVLTLADYRAGMARLGLTPVHFGLSKAGQLSVRTTLSLDGPLADGAVKGLVLPVDATLSPGGAVRFARDCAPLKWSSLRVGAATFDAAQFDLCGLGGDRLGIGRMALAGRLGDSALRVKADDAHYALGPGQFSLSGLDATIGSGPQPVHLAAASFDGGLAPKKGLAGSFAGGIARIGPVPFDMSQIAGQWNFRDGAMTSEGRLRLADTQADARFKPLVVEDAHFRLANSRIDVTGTLSPPVRKAQVARLIIHHDLTNGAGRADFKVDHLLFGGALQPDDLTPLSLGIVANVEGAVDGSGTISWSSKGVTASTGTFSTRDMNFAAAFGPVSGFATTIHFTDLLDLKTAPHQHLTVEKVSAGVDVFNGAVDYALLSKDQAQIEGGQWPFAGGVLDLLPDKLNLDSHQPRNLAFRVRGLDAGAFINTLDLQNVSATGTFDGIFPMVFDENGGRIDGGLLVARQQGLPPLILNTSGDALPACDTHRQAGTLAYVGPVSTAQIGALGHMAFDALKHLNYKCLVIRLDGALDGEFITRVQFNGINEGTEEARKSFLTRPFIGLPFLFNVRIEAPFRGLLNSAANFADPTDLIRSEIQREKEAASQRGLAVQPDESDKKVEGNPK